MGKDDDKLCRKLCKIIQNEYKIHAYDLIRQANISIGKYYSVKGYMEHHYIESVYYEKTTKSWIFTKKIVEEQEKLPIKSQGKDVLR